MKQAVVALDAGETRGAGRNRLRRLRELLGGDVAKADLPDLTDADQLVESGKSLAYRGLRIRLVKLVEVDVIGPQAPQAVLQSDPDVGWSGTPASVLANQVAELACDDHPAPAFEQ